MTAGSDRLAEELKVDTLRGAERALAEEAVRIKARLDSLDLWISGDQSTWFDLANRVGNDVDLYINAPLGEARQQALALRSVLAELAKIQAAIQEPAKPADSKADELKKKREQRLRGSA